MRTSNDIFIENLETLLLKFDWSNRTLSKKSGVSDRLIGMYRNKDSCPSIDKAEKIALALGFKLWQMQMPDFRPDVIADGKFETLYHVYVDSDDEGRQAIDSTASYVGQHKTKPSNDPNGNKNENGELTG